MRERLRFVNGEISIGAGPEGGTQVEVRIPMRAPVEPESDLHSHAMRVG
jgi:signal transduction histidine kinase